MACFGAHGLERPQLPRTMLQTTKITRNLVTIAAKLPNILLLKDAHCIGARLYSPGVTAKERHHLYDWNRPKSARQCFRSDATPSGEGRLQETYARQEENYAWGFGRSHETSSLAGWKLQETAPLAPGKKLPLRRSRETPAKHPCSLHGIYKNPRRSRQAGKPRVVKSPNNERSLEISARGRLLRVLYLKEISKSPPEMEAACPRRQVICLHRRPRCFANKVPIAISNV